MGSTGILKAILHKEFVEKIMIEIMAESAKFIASQRRLVD